MEQTPPTPPRRFGRWNPPQTLGARLALAVGLLFLAGLVQWLVLQPGWASATQIGGPQDSPWITNGFYTKERSDTNTFRWMDENGTLIIPATHTSYVVRLTATWGPPPVPGEYLQLHESGQPVATIPLTMDFRTYHFYWQPDSQRQWWRNDSGVALNLFAPTRIPEGDERSLSLALSGLQIATVGAASTAPFVWCGLILAGMLLLMRPQTWRGWGLGLGSALLVPLALTVVAWRPINSAWLPWIALPALLTLGIWGFVLVRWPWEGRLGSVPAWTLLGLLALVTALISKQWSVTGPDFEWHSNHGYNAEAVFRAHNFYPLGFPLILWLGKFTGDDLAVGRIICWISIIGASIATVVLARRILGWRGATVAAIIFLGAPVWMAFGGLASTDAAQLLPLCVGMLILGWQKELTRRRAIWAGVALGISYLFRHQSLMFTVLLCCWVLLQPVPAPERWLRHPVGKRLARGFGCLLVLGGFMLGSMPQWVLDIRDTGKPFHSKQYENIWLAAYDRTDPVVDQHGNTENTGVLDIVAFDPYQLGRHWSGNLRQFGMETLHQLFLWPLGLLVVVAIGLVLVSAADPRIKGMAIVCGLYLPIIALIWNKDRFYLPIMPLLVVLATWVVERCYDNSIGVGKYAVKLGTLLLVGLTVWVLRHLGALEGVLAVYGQLTNHF